jgi:hypothetical protein
VGLSTVRDYEKERRGGDAIGAKAIRLVLENHGVVFLSSEGDYGPGVRLIANMPNVLRRPVWLVSRYALLFPVEWRGREIEVFVSGEALADLANLQLGETRPDYIALFDEHRGRILKAAAAAIDAKRVMEDGRVCLSTDDFRREGG